MDADDSGNSNALDIAFRDRLPHRPDRTIKQLGDFRDLKKQPL
jgi:hypothetical protein